MKIAITGNIASGKSQIEKILKEKYHFIVIDSDELAHQVLNEMTDFYGYDVFTDSKIDRKKLGALVFSNPELKQKLETLTHPKIKEKILELFTKYKEEKFIFVSVPLLYEAGFEDMFDRVLLITTDENIQLKRLMERNNLTKKEALLRINSQMPQSEKVKKADYVISNNSSFLDLEKNLDKFVFELKQLAKI